MMMMRENIQNKENKLTVSVFLGKPFIYLLNTCKKYLYLYILKISAEQTPKCLIKLINCG